MYDINHFLDTFEIDYIMAGEGEIALDKLLTCLENKEEVCLQGVSTKEKRDDRLIPPVDLSYSETLDSPYLLERDKKDMKNRILYFETSRGCPYQCQYCLSSLEKGLRFFSMDYLKQQLDLLLETDVKVIKLLDRSFNAKTEHALEILDFVLNMLVQGFNYNLKSTEMFWIKELLTLLMKKHQMVYFVLKLAFNQLMNQLIR